jgi:hypothetical protein
VARNKSNNNNNDIDNDYLSPKGVAHHLNKAILGLQNIMSLAMKDYDKTGNLEALELAFQTNVALADAIKRVEQHYGHSYGHDFELTE